MFKNIPEDTLREWSRGQRASVGPSSIVLKQLDKFGEIQLFGHLALAVLGVFEHLFHEPIMEVGTSVKSEWEVLWYSLEEETKNTMAECSVTLDAWFESMDNVHLEVHELAVNRVLRWCVEVVLETVEVAAFNLWLEQANGRSSEEIL